MLRAAVMQRGCNPMTARTLHGVFGIHRSDGRDPLAGAETLGIDARWPNCWNPCSMQHVDETRPITLAELRALAAGRFGDLVKAVVDLARATQVTGLPARRSGA